MSQLLIAQSQYLGNYFAIWKIILFAIFFISWAWVGQWLDKDTILVRTNKLFWCYLYAGIGVGAIVLWVILPAPFFVGSLLFLVAWGTLTIVYILHRNARMPAVERILTPDHIRHIFSKDTTPKETKLRMIFFSANGNKLPVPHRQDKEFDGYTLAEELVYDLTSRRSSSAEWIPGDVVTLKYIIDGVPTMGGEKSKEDIDLAIGYVKAVADLDVADKRRPQTGSFTVEISGEKFDWRVKTSGSTIGEKIEFERIEEFETMAIGNLGFNPDQLSRLKEIIDQPSGVVLVSGQAGTGVTSTLYSLIRCHDAFIQNLCSLEKDALCELDNITQNVIDSQDNSATSSRRLQSVLLSDPDAVMVGFCDEAEMTTIGTKAALDGKKLYFGFDAPSGFHALQEWMKMVDDNQKVADTLKAITNQKLTRKLCPTCRQAYAPDPGLLKKLNLPADKIKRFYRPPKELEYDKHGNPILCETCQGTGYVGMTAVFETLFISDSIRELIREGAPFNTIRARCRKEKMMYLQEQALRKVIDGVTSIQEVKRITTPAG